MGKAFAEAPPSAPVASTAFLPGSQYRLARALLQMPQTDLAAACGVSLAQVQQLEKDEQSIEHAIQDRVRLCLERHGISFAPPDGPMLSVLLASPVAHAVIDRRFFARLAGYVPSGSTNPVRD